MDLARLTRTTVAGSLLAAAVLTIASISTMPDFAGDHVSRLEAIAGSSLATFSALAWVVSQVFILIGVVGVAHLTRHRAPVLSTVAAVLVGLSCFGHCVYGGVNLTMLSMADDRAGIATHAAVLDRLEAGIGIPFMAAGMLGLVLGFAALAVALWRSGVGPRWAGPALVAWLVLEFVGSSLSEWAFYGSGLLYLVIFGALAVAVRSSSTSHWRTEAEAAARTTDPATALV
ncbi:hypothetical protein GA707_15230 [Nostocoides sp. F2B08]|uniref:hypothetical protein n=1 Tax=Nostocoides sp. F2B08 TaxID=2653936 RepID=UPI001263B933|nr:hypothetical protein [Tetrasphaera sp. F2B08]KAB7742999.1 hypothetical protein GA707_15230 [Tetrasphaera sp. F2B08]